MNRLEEIKDRKAGSDSFRDWFEDGWNRNKGSIDDLITHNKQLSTNVEWLIEEVERLKGALEKADKAFERMATGNFSAPIELSQIEAYWAYAKSMHDFLKPYREE